MDEFVTETVLKSDEFSATRKGHFAADPGRALVRRDISPVARWARPVAIYLLRREERALRACAGIEGVPELVAADRNGLIRTWTEGQPLQVARPADAAFYRDAARILRALRRAGVTHNDLAKPQNWIVTPEGRAAVIDFQLARRHRHRGWRYRTMAYEDLRHLMKQKRTFAPGLLTPRQRRLAEERSLPSRIWRATGKRLYLFVTRRILDWSDGEGLGGRVERDGPATEAALMGLAGVRAVALVAYPRPGRVAGLCAFCEADPGTDPAALAEAQRAQGGRADAVEVVEALPRSENGAIRWDVLSAIALRKAAAPAG